MSASSFHLRFAVGSPNGPRSSIWRLVVDISKNEIYLAPRHIVGMLKISLHESGRWHVAFTQEYEKKSRDEGTWLRKSRFIDQWNRPSEIHPGATLAFRIIVPTNELRHAPIMNLKNKTIEWISPPPVPNAIEIVLILTKPTYRLNGWPGKTTMRTQLLTHFVLANKETLWLVHRIDLQSNERRDDIERIRSELRHNVNNQLSKKNKTRLVNPRLIIGGELNDGSQYVYDLAYDL